MDHLILFDASYFRVQVQSQFFKMCKSKQEQWSVFMIIVGPPRLVRQMSFVKKNQQHAKQY